MIKKFTVLFLMFTSTLVHSEWKYVTSTKDKDVDFYVDFDTLKKKDNLVTVWVKTEYKSTQRDGVLNFFNGYLSSRDFQQWDCGDKTVRTISFDKFSKSNLEGKIVETQSMMMEPPQIIRPDSSGSRMIKVICSK